VSDEMIMRNELIQVRVIISLRLWV